MDDRLMCAVLFKILSLAPMGESAARFDKLAAEGDVERFFSYYDRCMRTRPELDEKIEKDGQVSFRMLRPAMEAVYVAARVDGPSPNAAI